MEESATGLRGRYLRGAAGTLRRWPRKRSGRCMPRSGNWPSPTTVRKAYAAPLGPRSLLRYHESSSRGSASEARYDRAGSSCIVDQSAVPPAVDLSLVVLRRACGRDESEPRPDAADRPAVLGYPFYGVRQMMWYLQNKEYGVNQKRVRRLMRRCRSTRSPTLASRERAI